MNRQGLSARDVADSSSAVSEILRSALFSSGRAGVVLSVSPGSGVSALVRGVANTLFEDVRTIYMRGRSDLADVPYGVLSGFVAGLDPASSTFTAVRLTLDRIKAGNEDGTAFRTLIVLENASQLDDGTNYVMAQAALAGVARILLIEDDFLATGGDLDALRADGYLTHLKLRSTDMSTVTDTMATFLGGPVSRASAFFLWKLTSGNQRLLMEVLAWGRRSAFLDFSDGVWVVDEGKMHPDARAWDVVRTHLPALDPQERKLAETIALVGWMSHSSARALTDDETIHSLVSAGVLEHQGGIDRALHHRVPLVSLVLEQGIPPGRRQELRREVLSCPDSDDASSMGARSALWALECGEEPTAIALVRAAGWANDVGEPSLARALLRGLIGTSPSMTIQLEWARAELAFGSGMCAHEDTKAIDRVPGWPGSCAHLDGAWDIGLSHAEISQDASDALEASQAWSSTAEAGKLPSALASARALGQLIPDSTIGIAATWVADALSTPDAAMGHWGLLRLGETLAQNGRKAEADQIIPWLSDTSRLDVQEPRLRLLLVVRCILLLITVGDVSGAKRSLKYELERASPNPLTYRASIELLAAATEALSGELEPGLRNLRHAVAELASGDPASLRGFGAALSGYIAALVGEARPACESGTRDRPRGALSMRLIIDALRHAEALAGGDHDHVEAIQELAAQAATANLKATQRQILELLARHAPMTGFADLVAAVRNERQDLTELRSRLAVAKDDGQAELLIDIGREATHGTNYLLAADAYAAAIRFLEGSDDPRRAAVVRREFHVLIRKIPSLDVALYAQTSAVVELTERELEIVEHVFQGRKNRQIASDLFVSQRTVEGHLYRTYSKLGISTRSELKAMSNQLLESNNQRSSH